MVFKQESRAITKKTERMRPIYGCPEKFRESLHGYAHGYFARNFNGL